jgi:hypothetical protein
LSVIAKLIVRQSSNFGTGMLTELGCVCENDLMAAYAGSEEDRLFTKYSPWGEMRIHAGLSPAPKGKAVFAMLLQPEEIDRERLEYALDLANHVHPGYWLFPKAAMACEARIVSITDFGDNSAKTVEICSSYDARKTSWNVDNFNWKMSVDNPPATAQFRPGVSGYWMALYPADEFTRDQAIRAAHGHSEPEAA